MRKTRKNSSLLQYLTTSGVLERGSEQEIKEAKREFRKKYQKEYKQQYKKRNKDFAITCDAEEQVQLKIAAQKHGLKPSSFLKKAVFAYCNQTYLIPNVNIMNRILQLLLRYETMIERIAEKDKGAWYKTDRSYQDLEEAIAAIRNEVQEAFANPPRLEAVIRQTIQQKPEYRKTIQTIIAEYDSQKHGT